MDGIIDIATSLHQRTAKPNLWKQKQAEAEKRTRASFVAVFGGSSVQAKKDDAQGAQGAATTGSAQEAGEVAGQGAKEAQGATTDAQGGNAAGNGGTTTQNEVRKPVQASRKHRKGGAK